MQKEKRLLEGKTAVITGASRGLGKAMVELFARQGAKVILSGRSIKDIEKTATQLRREGCEAVAYACDVTKPNQVEALARKAIKAFGGFDIWVNNAGVPGPYGGTLDISGKQFMDVVNTNMLGVYTGSVTALRHFLPNNKGKLINVLGAGARKPAPNQNAYGSSKAWVRVFTLALAKEYRDSGVGIFAIQPGLMETGLLTEVVTFREHEQRLRNFMPVLIRAGGKRPDAAARKVLWLASPATDGKTGLDVRVGSFLGFFTGFLREGFSSLLHIPVRKIKMNIRVVPSAFKPIPK